MVRKRKQQNNVRLLEGNNTFTKEAIDRLIAEAPYKQHPYGKVWQPFDLDALAELAGNIDRRGLDQEILLYHGMILEGWHRYLACLATKTTPKFAEFQGSDLEAAERVHASGIRRQSTPEQRYASFLQLCEACPAFKAKYEALKEKGTKQQQAGKPLSTDGQRVDVLGAKAAAAGVSRATAAKIEKVKKHNPEAVADIAEGKTSANKVLNKTKKGDGAEQPGDTDAANPPGAAEEATPSLLGELNTIIDRIQKMLRLMEAVDWSKEDEGQWNKARRELRGAISLISTKAQQAFYKAMKESVLKTVADLRTSCNKEEANYQLSRLANAITEAASVEFSGTT